MCTCIYIYVYIYIYIYVCMLYIYMYVSTAYTYIHMDTCTYNVCGERARERASRQQLEPNPEPKVRRSFKALVSSRPNITDHLQKTGPRVQIPLRRSG